MATATAVAKGVAKDILYVDTCTSMYYDAGI